MSSSPSITRTFSRALGQTEVSYYLPSAREGGVNDMVLHIGFHAPPRLISPERLAIAWAIMRIRHPLLASSIHATGDEGEFEFRYTQPASAEDSLSSASQHISWLRRPGQEFHLPEFLNGPRVLSEDKLSFVVVIDSTQSGEAEAGTYDLVLSLIHAAGDGISLHLLLNDLFILLNDPLLSPSHLSSELLTAPTNLPACLEDQLPSPPPAAGAGLNRFRSAVSRVDFANHTRRQIGGHLLPYPRKPSPETKNILVRRLLFDEEKTKRMLRRCKENGVSITAALFALINVAWARTMGGGLVKELPLMIYTAMNLRPYLIPSNINAKESYNFLAISYFNVVLPAWFPAASTSSHSLPNGHANGSANTNDEKAQENKVPSQTQTQKLFWHRASLAKTQSVNAVRSPMLVSRQREMARQRFERVMRPIQRTTTTAPTYPSKCLLGASLMGNLSSSSSSSSSSNSNAPYTHSSYPHIHLHTLSGAPRLKPGGILVYGYTFVGRLCVDLVFDAGVFGGRGPEGPEGHEGVGRKRNFWDEYECALGEMLLH